MNVCGHLATANVVWHWNPGRCGVFGRKDVEDLFLPDGTGAFLATCWGRTAWHGAGDRDRLRGLFTTEAFWDLLRRPGQAPRIKARYTARNGAEQDLNEVPARLAPGLLDAGMTLCVRSLDVLHPGLRTFAEAAREVLAFSGESGVNLYASPHAQGFGWHYDCEHVLVLQLDGVKRWEFSAHPATPWPTAYLPSDAVFDPVEDPRVAALGTRVVPPPDGADIRSVTLSPGDVLYLPPAAWHRTAAQDHSVSLTLALHPLSFARVLRACWMTLEASNPAWRTELVPAGWEPLRQSTLPVALTDALAVPLDEVRAWAAEANPTKLVQSARAVLRPSGPHSGSGGAGAGTMLQRQSSASPERGLTFGAMLRAALVATAVGRVPWRRDLSPDGWPAGSDNPDEGMTRTLASLLDEARAWLGALDPAGLVAPLRQVPARREDAEWWSASARHL